MAGQADAAAANQRPSTTQFASSSNVQVSFAGGVNPMAPSHLLRDDEVQTATNIDFSLMRGALTPRRGCVLNTKLSTSSISRLYLNHNDNASIINGNLYAVDQEGVVYREHIFPNTGFTAIATIGSSGIAGAPAFGAAMQYTVFSAGTKHFKDDGTNVTEWIKQVPDRPVITINTLTPVTMTGTYTAINGTVAGTTSDTCTFVGDVNGNAVVNFVFTTASNLSLNGTNTIGNYGVHFIDIAFSDPQQVQSISLDYSIGDTAFNNFWHVELDPSQGGVYIGSNAIQQLIDANPLGTNTSATERADIYAQLAQNNFSPLSFAPTVANDLTPWGNTVPQFSFIGTQAPSSNLWNDIRALRIGCVSDVLNGTTTTTNTITAGHAQIWGAQNFPITDVINGYYYWQSYATLDTAGNKIDEGATSQPAGPYQMQNANVTVVNTATATGSQHGVNAIITYRQGGFMSQAYAIHTYTGTGTGTAVIAVSTITDTTPDLDALTAGFVMPPPLQAPFAFPGDVNAISALFKDRLFVANGNLMQWSLPGQFGSFPLDSFQEVGRIGDAISGFQLWNPGLVIVNRSSVYELVGNDFETGDYTLSRTGCRRGSLAPDTVITTPYGIPLLNTDGLFMYVPGYNTEQAITWFNEKYMDMFRGGDPDSPAVYKGNRIPAINLGSIHLSIAGFRNHQLYLGVPCGPTQNNQVPNTLVVLDFELKQAWWYTYPFSFTSILVDDRSRLIYLGSSDGSVMIIENGVGDQTTAGVTAPTVWSARTRQWTANTDSVAENISIDSEGNNIGVFAYYDNFYNPLVGTLTNHVRQYTTPPLGGTFVNAMAFDFIGTYLAVSSASSTLNAIYSMNFDILREPVKVQYWRTEYDEHAYTADKLWDVIYCDIDIPSTCTVSAVTFVDNTAVMTNTITGTGGGRYVYEFAFPPEIYGRVAYTTYTT